MRQRVLTWLGGVTVLLPAVAMPAQQPPVLGTVLSAFLADSGVPTRGLPWTTGNQIAVQWESAAPVTNPDTWLTKRGLTLMRAATARVPLEHDSLIDLSLHVYGTAAGVQRVALGFAYQGDVGTLRPRASVPALLEAQGFTLTLLKCDPKLEGETYGNLVYVMKTAGKIASALHLDWNCTAEGDCGFTMTILYRRNDLAQVDCATG